MGTDSTVAEVRQLLASVVGDEPVAALGDDELLFEHGVVDSLHLVEIVDRFQADLGVEVGGPDLSPENFGSIAGMAGFLASKREPTQSTSG
jgi:acyl carrier protein